MAEFRLDGDAIFVGIFSNSGGWDSTTSAGSSKMPRKNVIVKDQRDCGNKEYVASMIKDIVQVLSRLELNHVANEKTLSSPKSRKDFEAVFEALWSKILNREFKLDNAEDSKKNEQIKRMLTSLHYPFVLKDSTLKAMTAPCSWKTMLGVLHWLSDYIKAAFAFDYESLFQNPVNDYSQFFPTTELQKNIFKTSADCFLLSQRGCEANISNIEKQFSNQLKNRLKNCLVANKEVLECKVSALSRGLPRALEICRLSYDIYGQNANKNNKKKEVIKKTSRLSRKTVEIMVDRVNSYPCPKWTIRDAEQTKQFNSSIEVTAIR